MHKSPGGERKREREREGDGGREGWGERERPREGETGTATKADLNALRVAAYAGLAVDGVVLDAKGHGHFSFLETFQSEREG